MWRLKFRDEQCFEVAEITDANLAPAKNGWNAVK
jgi:hypothetical protein